MTSLFQLSTRIAVALAIATAWFGANGQPARAVEMGQQCYTQTHSHLAAAPNGETDTLKAGKVTITILNSDVFSAGELGDALAEPIATLSEQGLNAASADDSAYFLELYYRRHGFADAQVTYTVLTSTKLILKINAGRKQMLGVIQFQGNRYANDALLKEYIVGPLREQQRAGRRQFLFVGSAIDKGVDLVRGYYLAEGFLDSQVEDPIYSTSKDGSIVDVKVIISEGTQYHFGSIQLTGNLVYPEKDVFAAIAGDRRLPFTQARVDAMSRTLADFYKNRGHYEVQAVRESIGGPKTGDSQMPVQFHIVPGPVFRFGDTTVQGTVRLHPSFLRNRFCDLKGKIYQPQAFDDRYQEMSQMGLFNYLRINTVPVSDHTLRMDIQVNEAKARDVGISLGYGTYEGPIIGIEYRDRNLFGTGRPISIAIDYSARTLGGELTYQDKYFFESRNEFTLKVTALTRNLDAYTKREVGGSVEIARQVTKKIRLGMFSQLRRNNIISLDIEPENAGDVNYTTAPVGITAALDLRDNVIAPTKGFVSTFSFDAANRTLGGNLDFVRGTLRMSYLWPIGCTRTTLSLGARMGAVQTYGNTLTAYLGDPAAANPPYGKVIFPIDERFFNGGANSVRSFVERTLGPRDPKDDRPIGGQAYTIFNVEYTFPITSWVPDLRGAVFFDAGNLLSRADEFGLDHMRYATGLGLRYQLPVGPIRLDYGFNPDQAKNETTGTFQAAFGIVF